MFGSFYNSFEWPEPDNDPEKSIVPYISISYKASNFLHGRAIYAGHEYKLNSF